MFGLALEGGGALGAAHLGVLHALIDAGLTPSAIGGTSAGSIVAGVYAWRGQLSDVYDIFHDIDSMGSKILDLNVLGIITGIGGWIARRELNYKGVFKGDRLEKLVGEHVEGAVVAEARLPLVIPTVDLTSGELVLYSSRLPVNRGLEHWKRDATIAEAVRASISIPILFTPKELDGGMLVDGGVLQNLPISSVRALGETNVVGVSLHVSGEQSRPAKNVVDIARAMIGTVSMQQARRQLQEAAYVLEVVLPEGSGMFSFEDMDRFLDIGYESALKAIPQIKQSLVGSVGARVSIIRKV